MNQVHADSLVGRLAPTGRLVVLGAGRNPLPLSTGYWVSGERSVLVSIAGSPDESEKALNVSVLTDIRPMIEVIALERANEPTRR